MQQLCLFEDNLAKKFRPLTLTRPVDDLRVGILTIREKWKQLLPEATIARFTAPHLREVFTSEKLNPQKPVCWINARILPSPDLLDQLNTLDPNEGLCVDGQTIAACIQPSEASAEHLPDWDQITCAEIDRPIILENIWDLFVLNADEIRRDLSRLEAPVASKIPTHVQTTKKDQIYIGKNVTLEPGVILIAQEGPIYIDDGAKIMAGSIVRGPSAIGKDAVIKMGAKIYGKTTIGPVCKVGGEINNSIFHSYSNKGHDGFVGNSLIGQWCNLGADTNTSNLKNNYSPVRISDWDSGDEIQSDQQFIGTIMGDHTKTAINVMLNTGTVCGVSCNIFSSGFPPKLIPSFSWVGDESIDDYRFDKATETMELMMARRDVKLTDAYRRMLQQLLVMKQER